MNIAVTRITAVKPDRLSKAFSLTRDGQLAKASGGQLVDGTARTVHLQSMAELAQLLKQLTPAEALVYGISEHEEARVVSKKLLSKAKTNGGSPVITRTREYFTYPNKALLMADYDPKDEHSKKSATEFKQLLCGVVPGIGTAPHLLTPSASSFIYKNENCLRGAAGIRMLTAVKDGSDMPRAGEVLFKRLWLTGEGYIEVSGAGSLLVRAPLDAAVWQPERLDFCGGAYCEKPLEQRRPDPIVFNSEAEPLDTRQEIKSLSFKEEIEFKRLVEEAKKEVQPQADKVRNAWIDTHVTKHISKNPDADPEKIRETYKQAAKGGQLLSDFVLYPAEGGTVTVGEILDDPDKWHETRFADPLEPNYQNDGRIAFVNLHAAGRPYLYSNAHGGRKFWLVRQRATIRIIPGERVRATEEALNILKANGQHYIRGNEIVQVSGDAEVIPRDEKALLYDLDRDIRFEKYDGRKNDYAPCDCRPNIGAGIMAARGTWNLPRLLSVGTAPTLDPITGRIIDVDGYDKETQTMLCLTDRSKWPGVPEEPTDVDLETAVQGIWRPFRDFPFDSPVSKGVWLNALLTAAIRPLLPTAPGTAVTSPVAASGKTLLGKCGAALIDETPALLPDARDGEEIRKRLLALLRQGKRLLIIDNLTRTLDSSALCVMLTSETYQDRVLGATDVVTVPTRTTLIITGNNISLRGDICRRVLMCRIDPQSEAPWKRKFDLDPEIYVKEHRLEMIRDALTIIRAGIQRGPELDDRTASFEVWSDSVRRAVNFVGWMDLLDVEDPVKSIDESYEMDPETGKLDALMAAWKEHFKDKKVRTADIIEAATDGYEDSNRTFAHTNSDLHAAVEEIAGEGRNINSRRLGRWIERNRDRIVNGLSIKLAGERRRAKIWTIIG